MSSRIFSHLAVPVILFTFNYLALGFANQSPRSIETRTTINCEDSAQESQM